MRYPRSPHLQFLVLGTLREEDRAGKGIRAELARRGARRSGPAFYQLMARLEDTGLVDGRYEQRVDDGQTIKERRYRLTSSGLAAWEATRDFYLGQIEAHPATETPEGG